MTTALACAACSAGLRTTAKFCDACGSPISRSGPPAEYKQVTVLFADVVGSLDIAAAVGAERLREIMTELVNRSAATVHRYNGMLDKFTGDGVMAVFGAPAALEDHALRGCLAALGIQADASLLGAEVARRDGVRLRLRIGLNSGQVIAGEVGSIGLAYTAVGEQVGMARRMESIAPAGAVMLSASTARLVEGVATLGRVEEVQIKGRDEPVSARRLFNVGAARHRGAVPMSTLTGRKRELATLATMLDRSIAGRGSIVGLAGPAGIGKTRLADEILRHAKNRRVDVFCTFCESHATDVPFGVMVRLLRALGRIGGLDDHTARARMRAQLADADPEDMLLLDDLLGIADPAMPLPKVDADTRRRRLCALASAAQLVRTRPTVILIEDAHWIDAASEAMLVDFLTMSSSRHCLVLFTFRPDYCVPLQAVAGANIVPLAPLGDSEMTALVGELLGFDPSVGEISKLIAKHAAGNPFFAEEITRELVERGVLEGGRGDHTCRTDIAEIGVPVTLQVTIAARIDRLSHAAKGTLCAAAVIGSHFGPDLLAGLGIDAAIEELITAELVKRLESTESTEYVFSHPLIQTVAYQTQLKSDRAQLHRRLAAAIEARGSGSADSSAPLIAQHLEAAGDRHAAYSWHMRAATWAANRDVTTARQSWERAQEIADSLPADTPHCTAMRIAPRTMLCGIALRVPMKVAGPRFGELRELCSASGDKASLAIAMAGLVAEHALRDGLRQASQLASEAMALIESLAEPNLTIGLSTPLLYAKIEKGEWRDVLRWSHKVIDLAGGDPRRGNFLIGCPVAVAFATRAVARWYLGHSGWRSDLRYGLELARNADPISRAMVVTTYMGGVPNGVLEPDDQVIHDIDQALRFAEQSRDDSALALTQVTLGLALVHRQAVAMRDRGHRLLVQVSGREGYGASNSPIVTACLGREMARCGERDRAIALMRGALDALFREGRLAWDAAATGALVETLLDRGTESDMAEADVAIDRLAAAGDGIRLRDVWLLRLRALVAQARSDQTSYQSLRDRYTAMSKDSGYEGHIAWAAAMQ